MASRLTLLLKKSIPIDREAIIAQSLRLGQPPKWHQVKELRNGHQKKWLTAFRQRIG
ncbi:hypothetical protein LC608_05470 [Nostoc sp. XA010]|uniref:hypothetical protein n=1 Tax=Nostoc sp. XA010 TaxID=2780407 RepID=UPI001E4D3749|nr:hypothetical protein [Nostoc sp. XA010]MCC5656439.1 hypothetical protein [Nostoc sp. XA010]